MMKSVFDDSSSEGPKRRRLKMVDWSRALPLFESDAHVFAFLVEYLSNPRVAAHLSDPILEELRLRLWHMARTGALAKMTAAFLKSNPKESIDPLIQGIASGRWALLLRPAKKKPSSA